MITKEVFFDYDKNVLITAICIFGITIYKSTILK